MIKYLVFDPTPENLATLNTINAAGFASEKEDDYLITSISFFWAFIQEAIQTPTKISNVGDGVTQTTLQAIPTTANIRALAKIEDSVYQANLQALEALTGAVCFASASDFLVVYPQTKELTFNTYS